MADRQVYSIKFKRRKLKSPFFKDADTSTMVTGSGIIGKKVVRIAANVTFAHPNISNSKIEALSIVEETKTVRLIGEAVDSSLDEFRYGKDVKTTKHLLNDKISPNIALSDEGIKDGDDEFSSFIGAYNFGQNRLFKVVDQSYNLIPFRDMNGKLEPTNFLSKHQNLIEGFPYVYNAKTTYNQFLDSRDREYLNGVIDVFHTHLRNSEYSDISLRGAKGLVGLGDYYTSQNSSLTKKGSPVESDVFETKNTQHDFFEDASEIILELTSSNSQVGYVSTGKFKLSPFEETESFVNEYSHLTNNQKNTLLVSSSKDDFSLGTRFKSKQNGFIITPFYQLNQKRSFGKDSIAFSGLLKG